MKLMVIKAVENRLTKDVIINPEQVESIEAAEGMCRLTMASGRVKERKRTFAKVFDFWATAALMFIALTVFVGLAYKVNMWLVICLYWAVLALKNCALFAAHKDSDK